jgi:V/A-type H+-transporting ATPase subunit F
MLDKSKTVNAKEYKIGVIGDKESVIGFKAVGFSVFEAANVNEAEKILREVAREDYAVIYISENYVENMQSVIAEYRVLPIPAVIAIPGKSGSTGFGVGQIKKAVERAVGSDILFKDKE